VASGLDLSPKQVVILIPTVLFWITEISTGKRDVLYASPESDAEWVVYASASLIFVILMGAKKTASLFECERFINSESLRN
jgi:hypothetical protein